MECLITKLASAVQDASMVKLGEMRINVKSLPEWSVYNGWLQFTTSQDVVFEVIGGKAMLTLDGENFLPKIEFSGNETSQNIYFGNGDYVVSVLPKYGFTMLEMPSGAFSRNFGYNLDTFSAMNVIEIGCGGGASGNIESLQSNNLLEKLEVNGESRLLVGDIKHIAHTSLQSVILSSSSVSGDISSLGGCTSLRTLALADTQCYGAIEAFVVMQRAKGRKSASINAYLFSSGITFNGGKASGSGLSWTETTITYGGVTIDA
jgi:hypothetical protein